MNRFLFIIAFIAFSFSANGQTDLNIKRVTASSVFPADSASYHAKHAIDKKNATAWFPKRNNQANRGEWLKFEFEEPSVVTQVKIINGWVKDSHNWRHNSRVKTATITLSSGVSTDITLKDTMSVQTFDLPESEATWMKLTIKDIYRGKSYQEAGLTQVSVVGSTEAQRRLAKIREQKELEQARLKKLSDKAKEEEKAAYLASLKAKLKNQHSSLSVADYVSKVGELYSSEIYPEGKVLISQDVNSAIVATIGNFQQAKDSIALLDAYDSYTASALAVDFKEAIFTLFKAAYLMDIDTATENKSSAELVAVYIRYGAYYDENPFASLIDAALNIDGQTIPQLNNLDAAINLLPKYKPLPLNEKQQTEFQELLSSIINTQLPNINNITDLSGLLDRLSDYDFNLDNKKLVNKSLLSLSGISFRETFREGKIGERYVPVVSNSQSYNTTRYINGVALNETKFEDYTSGGFDENRYGFTAVYQFFNESEQTYLIEVEISATISSTEYQKSSSWSGPDRNVSVDRTNKMVQRNTYVLKAGSELKDQIVVGEKAPEDFLVSVVNITAVDAAWFDGLKSAMEGDDIKLTQTYFNDEKSSFWQPQIAANLARLSYMNIDFSIATDDKFDRDFKSPATIEFQNNNDIKLKLTYSANFLEQKRTVVLDAQSKFKDNVIAYGKHKDDLEITVEMLEPND